MTQFSSVIAGRVDLIIQRGDNTAWLFQWIHDGVPVDWSQHPGVEMAYRSGNRIVLLHKIDDGLSVYADPTWLKLRPWGQVNEKDLPPGSYEFDVKVPLFTNIIRYPIRGKAEVVDYITPVNN